MLPLSGHVQRASAAPPSSPRNRRIPTLPSLSRGEDASTSGSISFESYANSPGHVRYGRKKVLAHTPKLAGYDIVAPSHPRLNTCVKNWERTSRESGGRFSATQAPHRILGQARSTACWLTDECGVRRGDVGAILCKQPSVAWSA